MKYNNRVKLPEASPTITSRLSQHNPLAYVSHLLSGQPVYAIVRHPYVRALSLYTYAMSDGPMSKLLNNPSFEEFWDVDISAYCEWSLRTTQTQFLAHPTISVKTYKMEEPMGELYKLTKVMYYKRGINALTSPMSKHNNQRNKEIAESIFKEDYSSFSYKL